MTDEVALLPDEVALMRLGFIGSGAITSAIVKGLCAAEGLHCPIVLSPRNARVAAELAATYRQVRVAATNQQVLDDSDVVFLAVRPQVAHEVLTSVAFRPAHRVISLVATFSQQRIAALVGPAATVTCAVPLPTVASHKGPTAIYPADPVAAALFGRLGIAIEAASESEFQALWASTAMMATYFTWLDTVGTWLADHRVPAGRAREYVGMMFSGLGGIGQATGATFTELAQDFTTRGGLNEQCAAQLAEAGVFDACTRALDAILARIEARPVPADAASPGTPRPDA